MKKIVQVIDQLTVGGAERMSVNIANVLSERGIPNALICTRRTGPLVKELNSNCINYSLSKSSFFDLSNFIKFVKIIKKEKPDIIHAHSSSVFWPIIALFFIPKCKLLWHDHNGNIGESDRNYRKMIKLFSLRIDAIIAVNLKLLGWSETNTNVEHVRFIRNFSSLNAHQERSDKSMFEILLLANLRPVKNHLNALKAAEILKGRVQEKWHMYFVGEDFHDSYSSDVKKHIEENGLQDYVSLIGAVDDVEAWLNRASLGLLSSDFEGLPVSLLEYGLASLPVVVTNAGQCSDVIGDNSGTLVEIGDSLSLANAIEWHMTNKENSIQMGFNLNKRVINEYGANQFMKDYMSLINKLAV